jgi:DNA-directed RNA polymerase subunit L/ferredoxin-like protein FixX
MNKIILKNHSNFFTIFNTQNIPLSIINGIRRSIYSNVETYAISNINIIENNTVLHNEFLEHRISLIPILNQENIDIEKITLEISKKNDTNENLIITSTDFEINPKEYKKYIPNNIPITNLKPKEKLELVATVDKGNGKKHARYIPTSIAVFRNLVDIKIKNINIDEEKANFIINSCPKNILEYQNKKIIKKNENDCMFCNSCVKTSEAIDIEDLISINKKSYKNNNIYEFKVESKGQLTNKTILMKSIEKLIELFEISTELFKVNQNNYILPNLKHTYANILVEYLQEHKDVLYCGYKVPHPLFDYSVLQIKLKENISQTKIIKATIKKIVTILKDIHNEFSKL